MSEEELFCTIAIDRNLFFALTAQPSEGKIHIEMFPTGLAAVPREKKVYEDIYKNIADILRQASGWSIYRFDDSPDVFVALPAPDTVQPGASMFQYAKKAVETIKARTDGTGENVSEESEIPDIVRLRRDPSLFVAVDTPRSGVLNIVFTESSDAKMEATPEVVDLLQQIMQAKLTRHDVNVDGCNIISDISDPIKVNRGIKIISNDPRKRALAREAMESVAAAIHDGRNLTEALETIRDDEKEMLEVSQAEALEPKRTKPMRVIKNELIGTLTLKDMVPEETARKIVSKIIPTLGATLSAEFEEAAKTATHELVKGAEAQRKATAAIQYVVSGAYSGVGR